MVVRWWWWLTHTNRCQVSLSISDVVAIEGCVRKTSESELSKRAFSSSSKINTSNYRSALFSIVVIIIIVERKGTQFPRFTAVLLEGKWAPTELCVVIFIGFPRLSREEKVFELEEDIYLRSTERRKMKTSQREKAFMSQCELRQQPARTRHKQITTCFNQRTSLVRQDVSTDLRETRSGRTPTNKQSWAERRCSLSKGTIEPEHRSGSLYTMYQTIDWRCFSVVLPIRR